METSLEESRQIADYVSADDTWLFNLCVDIMKDAIVKESLQEAFDHMLKHPGNDTFRLMVKRIVEDRKIKEYLSNG